MMLGVNKVASIFKLVQVETAQELDEKAAR